MKLSYIGRNILKWKFIDGIPIYLQIVDELTVMIVREDYKPGEKLPSVRDLAMDAGVNPNTVQRALSELERKGLVRTERTSGRFVTTDEAVLKGVHDELSTNYMKEFVSKLHSIGMTNSDIIQSLQTYIKKEKI